MNFWKFERKKNLISIYHTKKINVLKKHTSNFKKNLPNKITIVRNDKVVAFSFKIRPRN